MRRRTVLASLAGVGALFGLSGLFVVTSRQQDAVIDVLRKRLAYLRLDEAGVRRFADDLVARGPISSANLHILAALAPLYERIGLTGNEKWRRALLHGEERITTQFLMSSDFFLHGEREDRTVRYLGYYEPLKDPVACNSPFARPITLGPAPAPASPAPPSPVSSAPSTAASMIPRATAAVR